jgi:predicted nucleic acid-binding protein
MVRGAMVDNDGWFMCRVGCVETVRAVGLAGGRAVAKAAREEWSLFGIVEVDERLVEGSIGLAIDHGLRTLDSLHLAAALVLPQDGLLFATWDRRLHAAAAAEGLQLLPGALG